MWVDITISHQIVCLLTMQGHRDELHMLICLKLSDHPGTAAGAEGEGMIELQLANLSRGTVLQTSCLRGSSCSPPLPRRTDSHSTQHPHPHPHSSYRDPATPVVHRHPLTSLALSFLFLLLLLRLKRLSRLGEFGHKIRSLSESSCCCPT